MKPWKSQRWAVSAVMRNQLQWGHGDEAVEENTGVSEPNPVKIASMGPRR